MPNMKILQLTKKFPFPLKDGEAIAITYLSKAFHKLDCELTLLSMNTSKHFFDINTLPADFNHYKSIQLVNIDNRVKVLDAFLNLFSNKSYHIERFVSAEFEKKLIALLQENDFDIIHLETLYLAPYIATIRKYSNAKIAMRSHNVEHEIWKRITENTGNSAKKWYLSLLTKRLENFEVSNLNLYDIMVAITDRDLDFFKNLGLKTPSMAAPIGLDLRDYPKMNLPEKDNPEFCFIGSLDWLPNTEGLKWLIDFVWPKVIEKYPDAKFHIAGRNAPEWLGDLKLQGIVFHAEVPDAVEFICKHSVMLVPLLSGSGMRVKILEGMAMGRLIISTDIGLEGISAKNNQDVMIANDPGKFAEAICFAYNNPQKVSEMGAAARNFVHLNFDNVSIAEKVIDAYRQIIRK